ncbi:MAG: hypothetical protein LBS49_01580, partial [Candidatus Accumulibacter sp.]|nr:hypothetical protein [Accumulibacter sp.]
MSGPKVVVTTETARKLCERDLRRLENESSLWLKRARKLGEFNEADYHETLARRDHLRELLRSERFLEVRKIADAEIAYLKNDLIEREIRSIERAASKRERQRRQKENTGILLKTLATKTLPPELEKKLRFLAQGEHLPDSEKILAQGFALLADTTPPSEALNDDRHQLASRLQTGISRVSLTEWLSSQAAGHRDERLKRIDRHIAELQSLEGESVAQPFLTRLAKAEREDNPAQRNLLLDSLVLDLAQTTRKRRELRERTGELQSIAIELAASPNADKALLARVETELAAPDPARVHSLMEECRT